MSTTKLVRVKYHYEYEMVVPETALDLAIDEVIEDACRSTDLPYEHLKDVGILTVQDLEATPENLAKVPSWISELDDDEE